MVDQGSSLRDKIEILLTDLIDTLDRQDVEALFYAAVPRWFTSDLYQALDPENAEEDLAWIHEFSFIGNLPGSRTDFMMQPMEREILNEIFLDRDPELYQQTQNQTLDYWIEHPFSDPVVQAQNVLYHRIFVDREVARGELIDLFERYAEERQLGAMEQLLKAADEACRYQGQLQQPSESLKGLITYMEARQAQLQGNWQLSQVKLGDVGEELEPILQPFFTRATGYAEAGLGNYADAIDSFLEAVEQFEEAEQLLGKERSLLEQADTLVEIGDAYVGLAETTISLDERRRRLDSKWGFLQGIYYLFLSLPLAVYLIQVIDLRVFLPQLWVIWRDVDWVKADLYAQATKHYREANRLLEGIDRPDKDLVAEEKLADLYLSVGDASQAHTLYEKLLDEMELSEYRRARIQVGLGQSLWLLGDEEAAEKQLNEVVPALIYFADAALEAQAQMVLGMIDAQSAEPENSLDHFHRALDLYLDRKSPNLAAATDVAEQLDQVAENELLSPDQQERALLEASRVVERWYPEQQRHRITKFFQQGFLFAVVVLGGLGLLNAIRVQSTTVVPNITYQVSTLLEPTKDFTPVLSQGVTSLDVSGEAKLKYVVNLLLAAFAGYLITVTVSGFLWLRNIDHHDAQKSRRSAVVQLTKEGLSKGEGSDQKTIAFTEVARYIINNTRLFRRPTTESYLLLESKSTETVAVEGSTAHYQRLQQHIEENLPETTERVDQSQSLLISMAGVLLLFSVLLYLILAILNYFASPTMQKTLGGSSYSVATLYPYLLLGFLIPPLWWFVWKPLQRRNRQDIYDWSPLLLIVLGLLVALMVIILGFRYRLTTPDLYPALIAISLVLAGVFALTVRAVRRRRRTADDIESNQPQFPSEETDEGKRGVYASAVRMTRRVEEYSRRMPDYARTILFIALYLVLIAVAGLMIVYLIHEIQAYHLRIEGDALRNQAIKLMKDPDVPDADWEALLEEAQERYSEAIGLVETENWQVYHRETLADIYNSRAHAELMFGTEVLTPTLATNEETLKPIPSNYEEALEDYTKAIDLQPEAPEGYLWRGFTNHALGNDDAALDDYACAIILSSGLTQEELSKWISSENCPMPTRLPDELQLKPENVVKALSGRGWIFFSKANAESEKDKKKAEAYYQNALVNFLLATKYADIMDKELAGVFKPVSNQAHIEASLGLGYANYKTERYGAAMEAWQQALERDPDNAELLISLGTGYWRQGTIPEGSADETGSDRCLNDALDNVEKQRVAGLLEESIKFFNRSLAVGDQTDEDLAFTYRTRAQVEYLLRNCPGYVKEDVLREAIASYSAAMDLDEQNSAYPIMRSRLGYSLWLNTALEGLDKEKIIVQALADLYETLRLDGMPLNCDGAPTDYEPCTFWYPDIYRNGMTQILETGGNFYKAGDYQTAISYYTLLTGRDPELPDSYRAHLRLGLSELALGNNDLAREWFDSGISLAVAQDDKIAIGRTWQELRKLSETDPTLDIGPIRTVFDELEFGYDAVTPFERGAQALASGHIDQAREAYIQGADIAADIGDLESVKVALLDLLDEPQQGYEEMLDVFRERVPQLSAAAESESAVEETFDLAFIAWALGETEMGGRWYQEGIRRTAVIPGTYYQGLHPAQEDLYQFWQQGAPADARALISAMIAYRQQQLDQHPHMLGDKRYWRYQGWFKYYVGLKAFLVGDLNGAYAVLESAKRDTVAALKVDEAYNTNIHDYMHQGAWSSYYYERASLAEEKGDDRSALADYLKALEAYPDEVTDPWTQGELVDTALSAGFAAFKLGDREEALRLYEFAVEQAEVFGIEEQLQDARDDLLAMEPEDEATAELQKEILELLGSD